MLNWCLAEQPGREVWLFYGVRNSRELVMKAHLEALAAAHPNFHLRLCFSDPLPDDVAGRDYQHRGRVDVDLLRAAIAAQALSLLHLRPDADDGKPGARRWKIGACRMRASTSRLSARPRSSAGQRQCRRPLQADCNQRHRRHLRQIRQTTAVATRSRQPARICRGQWDTCRFRLPCRRLRHLPDDDPSPAK